VADANTSELVSNVAKNLLNSLEAVQGSGIHGLDPIEVNSTVFQENSSLPSSRGCAANSVSVGRSKKKRKGSGVNYSQRHLE